MMEKILFDPQGANALNRLVQSKIAPHLFIICNYNPDAFNLFSNDAKFIQGIANLYKFSIDTSLINKLKRIDDELGGIIRRKSENRIRELEKYLETISYLRTYAFHNNDHNDKIDKTEEWLMHSIHKRQFESPEDYALALNELEKLGNNIFTVTTEILNQMVKEYSREKLCEVFQLYILRFYKALEGNTNTSLFKEELRAAYRAKSYYRGIVRDDFLGRWCRNKYLKDQQDQLMLLSSYLPRVKGESKRKISDRINQIQKDIDTIQQKIAQSSDRCKGDISQLRMYDYLEFYRKESVDKCATILSDILKRQLTMLPQDMFQYIISNDFEFVPIDED